MDREAVWRAVERERSRLADLLDQLSPEEWDRPSLCTGWTVREVAAHVSHAPRVGPLSPFREVLRSGFNFNKMVDRTARRDGGQPTATLVANMRAMAADRGMAFYMTPLEALLDVCTHSQDIALPLGRHHPIPRDSARASAERIYTMGFPFLAKRRLRGFMLSATDVSWSRGEGLPVEGPIGSLMLVAAGRTAAGLDGCRGRGADELARRVAS